MGLIGINGRSVVSDEARRRAFLKHAYERGFHDGLHAGESVRGYEGDEEAQMRYRIGLRIGKRERQRLHA